MIRLIFAAVCIYEIFLMIDMFSRSNRNGRTAIYLIFSVALLFAVWLVLKTTTKPVQSNQNATSETKGVVSNSENNEASSTEKPRMNVQKKSKSDESEGSTKQKQKESNLGKKKDNGNSKNENELEKNSDSKSDNTTESKANSNRNQSKSFTEETTSGSTEQSIERTKQRENGSEQTEKLKGKNKKDQIKANQENKGQGKEQKENQNKEEQKTKEQNQTVQKAEQLYQEKKFSRAIERLNRAIQEVQSKEKKKTLRSKRSSWQEQLKQKKNLSELWVKKAERAKENANWEEVISHANKAIGYLPSNSKARQLLSKAKKKKKYQNMVKIPGGAYPSVKDQNQKSNSISSFYIDRHEVTNAEYRKFVKETGHEAPLVWDGREIPDGKGRHPVTGIRFSDARAYASWAGKRLPAANEWEAAARGKNNRMYPWGNSKQVTGTMPANTAEVGNNDTVPVDEYKKGCTPNNLCHMLGNVAEWTSTDVQKSGESRKFIVKGGSYLYPIEKGLPEREMLRDPDAMLIGIGFRCVKDPE